MPRWPIIPDRAARTLAQLLGYAPERISAKWVNISEAFDTHSGSIVSYAGSGGVSDVSFSSDADGTIFQVQNNVSVDGWREGPCKALPMATVFPEFVNDGKWMLTLLGIGNTTFVGNMANKWQSCGITGLPDGSAAGMALGLRNYVNAGYAAPIGPGTWVLTSTITDDVVRGIVFRGSNAAYQSAAWGGTSGSSASGGGTIAGDPYLTVSAGCASTGSTGPHTTDVTWFGFVSELPTTNPY